MLGSDPSPASESNGSSATVRLELVRDPEESKIHANRQSLGGRRHLMSQVSRDTIDPILVRIIKNSFPTTRSTSVILSSAKVPGPAQEGTFGGRVWRSRTRLSNLMWHHWTKELLLRHVHQKCSNNSNRMTTFWSKTQLEGGRKRHPTQLCGILSHQRSLWNSHRKIMKRMAIYLTKEKTCLQKKVPNNLVKLCILKNGCVGWLKTSRCMLSSIREK